MIQRTRRDFLKDVGTGVVVASVGSSLAADLGFSPAFADEGPERLTFGPLEPLVSLMQETPPTCSWCSRPTMPTADGGSIAGGRRPAPVRWKHPLCDPPHRSARLQRLVFCNRQY